MKARVLKNYRLVNAIYEQRIAHDTPEQIINFISHLFLLSHILGT